MMPHKCTAAAAAAGIWYMSSESTSFLQPEGTTPHVHPNVQYYDISILLIWKIFIHTIRITYAV